MPEKFRRFINNATEPPHAHRSRCAGMRGHDNRNTQPTVLAWWDRYLGADRTEDA